MHHPIDPIGASRSPIRAPGGLASLLLTAIAALAMLHPAGGVLAAQETVEDPFVAPGFVVTATRTPLGREALANPVAVITGASLRESGIRTVADALRSVPGVAIVQSGSAGAQTSLFLRGGESDYVRVLVDGVPINEAGGAIDLVDLSTDQVERIEVLRGSGSVVYGSDAAVGVIQIFTRRGRGAPTLEVEALGGIGARRYETGSYGLSDMGVTLSGGSGALSYSAGGSRATTAGAYPFNNERTFHTANGRVAWRRAGAGGVTLATRFSDSESHFPTDGSGNLADENQAFDRRLWTTSLDAGRPLGDRFELQLSLGISSRRSVSRDEQDGPDDTSGTYASHSVTEVSRRSVELRLNAELPHSTVTLGLAHDGSEGSYAYDSDGEFGPFGAAADYSRSNTATYVQLLSEPVEGLHATLGGRLDHNETFGRFDTYRLGLSWSSWQGGRVRGAIGRSFREPTFGENYGSGFGDTGDPGLLPERIRSWEIGVEQEVGPLQLAATWFDQTFHDLIQYTSQTTEPTDPNYVNVGAADAVGLEVSADAAIGRVGLSGSYTRLFTEVLDPGLSTNATFVEGEALLRRPEHSGSLSARVAGERATLGVAMNAVGDRIDVDYGESFQGERVMLPGYATFDLFGRVALPWGPGTELLARIENALDAEYEGIARFPAPGRIVRIGARLTIGGS